MSERGKELYRKGVDAAVENGRGHETLAARRLMQDMILPLAEKLEEWVNITGPGKNGLFRPILRTVEPATAIYLALYCIFDSFTFEVSLTTTASKIGRMIEDDLRFSHFQNLHKDYYDEVLADFKRKGTTDYRYKHRVLTHKANEFNDEWVSWAQSEKVGVGMKLIDIVLEHTDLIEKIEFKQKGKSHVRIAPTADTEKWIEENHEVRELMYPERTPCIIEPDKWTDLDQGGYYSPELRASVKMVKTKPGPHHKHVRRRMGEQMAPVIKAINAVQQTPWQVNQRILDVMQIVWAKSLRIGMPGKDKLEPPECPVPRDLHVDSMTPEQVAAFEDWKHEASEVHTAEKERIAKSFQLARIMRMAQDYRDYERFWYVWYFDFRGRMYSATSVFSPQGPDVGKAMIRFADGKPLGEKGMYWLKVNIANRFGFDKEDYDVRVKWVEDQHQVWMDVAEDPISNRQHWANADKPWQMLAAIFEYSDAHIQEALGMPISEFVSHIPIGLDGSCNGLQNFSAMLRDEIGGRATNLVPAEKPSDIYTQVGTVCAGKVQDRQSRQDTSLTQEELEYNLQWYRIIERYGKGTTLPRVFPKRPVMTLPYGATRQSCTKYIFEAIGKTEGKVGKAHHDLIIPTGKFKASTYLTPLMWQSIGEVVVAAREAMDWLQKCAGVVGKQNTPIHWTTPDGFPVWQAVYKTEEVRVRTQLAGDFRIKLNNWTDDIDVRAMRQAVSPNFVHSMDATHLRETVRRCADEGITALACIHDDYGTHACNTEALHRIIREAFVFIYENHCPLTEFSDTQTELGHELPDVPAKGNLDIRLVLQSKFFFG
ncbi:DNA-directed RNA polymerase [Rhizobium phage Paso]|uniref:DNA-directed RNA polymerase n=1 Tax=Rhizobium phage Paso TaxID=2767574 RepID=A0A7L8G685_9CAUD|nr:DNA-directed RNA polymerase [Rhizobium phage Paso]